MNALLWGVTVCALLSIACSLATCAFTKAASDYRLGRRDTRAVAFHQWTERVVSRCQR